MAERERSMIAFLIRDGKPFQAHVYGIDVKTPKAVEERARFVKDHCECDSVKYATIDMSPTCAWILLEKVCPFDCKLLGTLRMDRPELMFSTLHRVKGYGTLVQTHYERMDECNYKIHEESGDFEAALPF